jgi:hypothetical protein
MIEKIDKKIVNFFVDKGFKFSEGFPLVRSKNKHSYNFSPIINLLEKYINKDSNKEIYIQNCYRDIYPQQLYNPFAQTVNRVVSIHSYNEETTIYELQNLIIEFLSEMEIDLGNVYFLVPDLSDFHQHLHREKNILYLRNNSSRLKCKLPLYGEHYYYRILYHYNNGMITLANFVLVNYKCNGKFSIDSVIYPNRLEMIINRDDSIKYNFSKALISQIDLLSKPSQNLILGNMFGIMCFLSENVGMSSKSTGYIVKKLFKQILDELYTNSKLDQSYINLIVAEFRKEYQNDFSTAVENYIKNIVNKKSKYFNNTLLTNKEYLETTMGISKRVIDFWCGNLDDFQNKKSTIAYHFDIKENTIFDPVADFNH